VEYVRLRRSHLRVSRLGFGCEPLGGTDWGEVDVCTIQKAVQTAYERGVTLFDTADVYGLGLSEQRLAEALGTNRHSAVISTKFGVNWREDPKWTRAETFLDSSPKRVRKALANSLERLRIDHIPLYFVHWPDATTPLEVTLLALKCYQENGQIGEIGLSNFSASQIEQASSLVRIAAVQLQYNLIDCQAEEELLPLCEQLGISVIAYGTLAQGLLTGKYDESVAFDENDRRYRLPHFQPAHIERNLAAVRRLREVGGRYNKAPAQVAIRWVLEHPAVDAVIVGAKTPTQVESNLGAMDWTLSKDDYHYLATDY